MKKIFYFLIFWLGFIVCAQAQHYKKDGTPDRRYKSSSSKIYTGYGKASHRSSLEKKKRNAKAKYQFMKQTGYPHGRPGYVVDHIIPLKKGGCDCPSNMQWQTKEASKAKDKWE